MVYLGVVALLANSKGEVTDIMQVVVSENRMWLVPDSSDKTLEFIPLKREYKDGRKVIRLMAA